MVEGKLSADTQINRTRKRKVPPAEHSVKTVFRGNFFYYKNVYRLVMILAVCTMYCFYFLYVNGLAFNGLDLLLTIYLAIMVILRTDRRKRNFISIFIGAAIYPSIDYCLWFVDRFPHTAKNFALVYLAEAIILMYEAYSKRQLRDRLRFYWTYLPRVTAFVTILISIGVCVNTRTIGLHIKDKADYVPYSELEEHSLANHMELISNLDEAKWMDVRDDDEKVWEILTTYLLIESRYLGSSDGAPKLELSKLDDDTLGRYEHLKGTIYLSDEAYERSKKMENGYELIKILSHECYHRYQNQQLDLMTSLREDRQYKRYSNLLLFDDCRIWEKEITDYKDGTKDFMAYYNQSLEADCREYSEETYHVVRKRVKTYLETGFKE